ncbi:MAG: hypothetical protein ACP5I3_11960 [Thermoproteus sp.]
MGYLGYLSKSYLRNRQMLFWGPTWWAFWIALGAYVYPRGFQLPPSAPVGEFARSYTAVWLSEGVAYLPTVAGVGVVATILYSTAAYPYLIRFGRATPRKITLSLFLSALAAALVLDATLIATGVLVMAGGLRHSGFDVGLPDVLPASLVNAVEFAGISVLASVFVTALSTALAAAAGAAPKYSRAISFTPMLLFFFFAFSALYGALPEWLLVSSPFSALVYLGVYAYTGTVPNVALAKPPPLSNNSVPLGLCLASVILWTLALLAAAALAVGRMAYKPPAEEREGA